jgi:hypothetical protein
MCEIIIKNKNKKLLSEIVVRLGNEAVVFKILHKGGHLLTNCCS